MKSLKFMISLSAAACILLRPGAAISGAQSAMAQWAFTVAPALFPFLALLPSLTGREACMVYQRIFGKFMGALGLPAGAAPAVIIGMIAGSPGGALALMRVAPHTNMTRAQCRRIALSICGVSPAYLILGVGKGLCGDAGVGLRLAGMQMLTQLILLVLLHPQERGEKIATIYGEQSRPGITAAVETVLGICGYMVLFSAVTSVLGEIVGKHAGQYLLLAADLPSGLPVFAGKPVLAAAGIGFAGLCIAAQNLDALRTIGIKPANYLGMRCISALMMAALAVIVLPDTDLHTGKAFSPRQIYAFSLLSASILMIPILNFLSKNLFLNKRKFLKASSESC